MTIPSPLSTQPHPHGTGVLAPDGWAQVPYSAEEKRPILDLTGIDLSRRVLDRKGLEAINPHRHEMALLDGIVWRSGDFKQGLAYWQVREDEFWVRGHFPGKPMLPGVLQIEAGAQLGVYMYNSRFPEPRICAFTHIDQVAYRNPVLPGEMFYLLCHELKCSGRRFTSHIQGMVLAPGEPIDKAKITFGALISGMSLG